MASCVRLQSQSIYRHGYNSHSTSTKFLSYQRIGYRTFMNDSRNLIKYNGYKLNKLNKMNQRLCQSQTQTQTQTQFTLSKRHQSLYITKIALDLCKARVTINPGTWVENGADWAYWAFYKWTFVGIFVIFSGPIYWMMPYIGDLARWLCYHTLELYDDAYRDPLIPPESVFTHNHNMFIKQLEIRKERLQKMKAKENDMKFDLKHKNEAKQLQHDTMVKEFKSQMKRIVQM